MLDFDLHVYNITSDELVSVTSDGVRNIVYNGIPDWAYEGWEGGREGNSIRNSRNLVQIHAHCNSPVYVHVFK